MIRIGTAGYAYKDWEGPVFPSPKPKGFDGLRFMAQLFPCIEMNTSFYGIPKPAVVARWAETVSDRPDFRFTFKLYRGLTHGTEDDSLDSFRRALAPCRDTGKLGAVLLQFPYYFRNTQANRARVAWLARGLSGWPCAIEVRDRSWLIPPALDFFRRLELNLCAIDICQTRDAVPPEPLATGPVGYVRLHGRNADAWFDKNAPMVEKYNYLYRGGELDEWAGKIREIMAAAEATYVITNNHFAGKAVVNALQLARKLLGSASAPAPPLSLRATYPDAFPDTPPGHA